MTIVRLTALVLQNVQVVRGYLVRRVLERERGGGGGMLFCLHITYDEPEWICDLSFSLNVHCVVLYIVCTTRTSKRLPLVSRFREREEKTYGGFVVPLVQSSILYILYNI